MTTALIDMKFMETIPISGIMKVLIFADTHNFFHIVPQIFVTKICNVGRIFYRSTMNFYQLKLKQCTETVTFIGNLT